MLTLEETIERILKNRTDLERKDILKMIEDKRQELGPEVINDESAAMIVARELGVDLHQMSASSRLKIEDITETTRNVAITARVDHIEGVRTFIKKDGGGEGKVTSIRVSDESGSIKVVLWDELTKIVDENLISIDDVIQVRGGFVRKGLGESLELSLGRMGHIRQLEDYEVEELGIEFGASQSEDMKISDLKEGLFGISVKAKIQRVFRLSTFTRQRDGSEGKVLSMIVADDTGSARFVFWDDSATEMENAEEEEVIRLRNVNTRPNRDGTEVEVHVGRSSTIERNLKDKIEAVEGAPIGGGAEPLGKKDIAELMPGMGNVDIEGKVVTAHDVREFTTKDGKEGRVRNLELADKSGRTRVAFWNEDIDKIVDIKEDDIVRILHGYVKEGYRGGVEFGAGRKSEIIINPKDSKLKKLDVSQLAAPIRDEAESLGMKDIVDLSTGMWDVDIEGKVVTVYDVNTFTTKDNKEGRVRNLILADESGQTRVAFWNDDVDKIEDIKETDIVRILHGYVKEGYRGGVEFQVGKKAEIEINPKGSKLKKLDVSQVSLQPLTKAARVPIGDVGDNYEDKNVEVCGIVVNLSQSMSPIYQACPSCNKKLDGSEGEYICKSCGKVESPEPRMLYKITVDDGSGSIRVTLFGKVGEELLQMTAKEADEIIKKSGVDEQPLIDNSEKVVGKYISVYGRIKKYRESLDLSANGFEFADPVREVKRLKEEIQKEVA